MFYALFIPLQFNSIGFYSTFEKTTTAVKITVRNFYGDDNDNQKKKKKKGNDAFDLHSFRPHTKDGDSNYYNDWYNYCHGNDDIEKVTRCPFPIGI